MSHAYLTIDPLGDLASTRRYQIREKILTLHENYQIKDESGQPAFNVRSKVLTLGTNIIIEDLAGNGLLKIEEELFHLKSTFKILSVRSGEENRELAVVKKKFTLHEKFNIKSSYGNYELEANDLWGRAIILKKDGRIIAIIGRQWSKLADAYGIEVDAAEDQAFVIALAIVISEALYYY